MKVFHTPQEQMPDRCEKCIIVMESGLVLEVAYSTKHKMFNAYNNSTVEAAKENALEPLVWCYKTDFYKLGGIYKLVTKSRKEWLNK